MPCPTLNELPPPPAGKSGWPWSEATPPFVDELYCGCDENRSFSSAITQEQNSGFHTEQSIAVSTDNAAWPKMTIVTPAYNAAAFIEETMRSVLLQGYPNLEYMVIDGGSSDGTAEIIRRYAPWLSFWCSERDRGQSHALNKGFGRATGDWLAWLNADDIYRPNALYAVATSARRQPDSHWIVGVLRWMDEHGGDAGATAPTPFAEVNNPAQWRGSRWLAQVCFRGSGLFCPQPVSFWSRTAQAAVGPLDESLHYSMDLDRWGKLAYAHFVPTLIPAELAAFRLHDAQKSATGELRFMVDELAIVDNWLPKLNGQEYQTLADYRVWLDKELRVQRRQLQWQKLMRNPTYHAAFTLAKNILNSTNLSKLLLQQLNKRRPAWMFFYG